MTTTEEKWEKLLQIKTDGRDDTIADEYHYPYEPTPYSVLERLADSGYIRKGDRVLDYGCGKGRVDFFLAHTAGAETVGIEYDERIYKSALLNKSTARDGANTEFILARAEEYEVPHNITGCYFFNPFSAEILHGVMAKITQSYYEAPRRIYLFFYYPSDEYVSYLMTSDAPEFVEEISCNDLFPAKDTRERILIFCLP
ncbi:MAG: class I SAM-dependent methyltransferase [Clostridia bacterium]|nr:class I SAM-dependent methyltransferase [Clostridia bacterium]